MAVTGLRLTVHGCAGLQRLRHRVMRTALRRRVHHPKDQPDDTLSDGRRLCGILRLRRQRSRSDQRKSQYDHAEFHFPVVRGFGRPANPWAFKRS
jgi:hypothetical protein